MSPLRERFPGREGSVVHRAARIRYRRSLRFHNELDRNHHAGIGGVARDGHRAWIGSGRERARVGGDRDRRAAVHGLRRKPTAGGRGCGNAGNRQRAFPGIRDPDESRSV